MRYANTDLRDLYRRGSGLTFRRLKVLVKSLPPTQVGMDGVVHGARVWLEQAAAEEKAKIPTADKIKERQEYWRSRGN